MKPSNSTCVYNYSPFDTWVLILQTIEKIPDGLMDIAKANLAKNRYHNIHTCESENAKV